MNLLGKVLAFSRWPHSNSEFPSWPEARRASPPAAHISPERSYSRTRTRRGPFYRPQPRLAGRGPHLGSRPVLLEDFVDGRNSPVRNARLQLEYARALKASPRLVVRETPVDLALPAWLASLAAL
jgi:hypothetical protein